MSVTPPPAYSELMGMTIGRWTVLCLTTAHPNGRPQCLCRCVCGTIKAVIINSLKSGRSNSCGCLQRDKASKNRKPLIGRQFGYLTVLSQNGISSDRRVLYLCQCSCGRRHTVSSHNLLAGCTVSCGCYKLVVCREKMLGDNNPQWRFDKSDEEREKTRSHPKTWEWRKGVYDRDQYTCKKCQQKGGRLNAHHIYAYATYPSMRYDLANGVTLCQKCHRQFHKQFGKTGNTKEQFTLFLGVVNGYN